MSEDQEIKRNLAAIRERIVAALKDDEEATKVLDRVWPADWGRAPEAVVWMLSNAARFAGDDPYSSSPEYMQSWLDQLVHPDGEPIDA